MIEIKHLTKEFNDKSGKVVALRDVTATIQDGDIIAILTSKKGLDYAHLGFAKWGRDGRLHLLNASMLYHRVVLDEVPLETYLSKHPSFIGIRLFRLKRAE